MKKRLMMLAAMVAIALPLMAATEVVGGITWTYTVSGGKASVGGGSSSSTAVPTSTSGAITIPSTLGGYSVTSIGSSAFSGCSGLTSVTIPAGVTSIGSYAFQNCSGLTNMTILAGVTNIEAYAFYSCSGLTSVTIPAGVTSIEEAAFGSCSGLTSVTIPVGVTSIGKFAFRDCSGLTSVTIPASVTIIGNYAFDRCSGLTSVTIGSGVTSIGERAFQSCSGLTSVTIPDGVTSIGSSAFSFCSRLEKVVFLGPFIGDEIGGFNKKDAIRFCRKYGREWLAYVGVDNFYGFYDDEPIVAEVVSTAMRANNPTVMDVDYIVRSTNDTAKVRVLAFSGGEQSFSNIVRAVTFVDGTESSVGDNVSANTTNRLSWQVSADWNTDLAQVAFGVIAMDDSLLPLYLTTIPRTETHDALTFSWNRIDNADVMKALFWLVADGDEGLVIQNGILKTSNGGIVLAQGTTLKNPEQALRYIYGKMGFDVLAGDDLAYVKTVSRLNLSPSGSVQYAVKRETSAASE